MSNFNNFNHNPGGSGNSKSPNPFDFDDDDQSHIDLSTSIPAIHNRYDAPAHSPGRSNDIEMQHTSSSSPTTPPFQTGQQNTGSNPVFNPIIYEDRAYASNTGESTSPGHVHGSGYQSPERTVQQV
ncbi:unnamed protein product [Ambrosiozyma monospora]|uniref:Unnamed protein product n=1 Tax=Ambrosiozyma monospora TaxID=43982 RepID=A0A9W6YZX1_AMBMO|nr:unnamed protein product [Ambrosiozyma monospora]